MASARLHPLGCTHLYVAFRPEGRTTGAAFDATQGPVYLGTAESSPVVDAQQFYAGIKADRSGRTADWLLFDDGEEHVVSLVLNRFSGGVWRQVRDRHHHRLRSDTHGRDDRLKRGSVVQYSGDFQLYLRHEFTGFDPIHPGAVAEIPGIDSFFTPYGFTDSEPGRRYYSVVLQAFREDRTESRIDAVAASFRCTPLYDPGTKTFTLYSEFADYSSLPSPE